MPDLPQTRALFPLDDKSAAICSLCRAEMPNDEWDICDDCIERVEQLDVRRNAEGHRL